MITVNHTKAVAIAHGMRRAARAKEFAPFDDVIAKQIPGEAAVAEAARESIRQKYAQLQLEIDATQSFAELKALVDARGL